MPTREYHAYVSLDSEQSIAVYNMDPLSGELLFAQKVPAGGSPGSLAIDPSHRYLYAAIRSTGSVSCFRIDPTSGNLSLLKTVRVAGNPVYVSTDNAGKYLLTAYFGDSKAAIYPIRSDGSVGDTASAAVATPQNPHAIRTDPSNRFLFIPCRTGEAILQYRFDSALGKLIPNSPDRIATNPPTGPRHLEFHRQLDMVYFTNEFGSTVTACRLNASNGTLSAFQTVSMLPTDFTGVNTAADIHLTPDDRFLYASNRGHDSIAAFSLDPATGAMTSIGHFATEKTPREFDIDPSGKFLYAGGQGSGKLAAYRIDSANGRLTRFATYDVGQFPMWVLVVEAPHT